MMRMRLDRPKGASCPVSTLFVSIAAVHACERIAIPTAMLSSPGDCSDFSDATQFKAGPGLTDDRSQNQKDIPRPGSQFLCMDGNPHHHLPLPGLV